MATTALGRLTLDLAVRMSDFSEGMSRAARETAQRTDEMNNSVTSFKDNLLESLSGTPIGGAIDSLNQKLGSITDAFGESGLSGAAKMGALAVGGAVAAMGAGLVTLALQTAEADKELVKLADRAKVSTKQLQVLTAATASYGLEADGLSDILADVQEKLGEFSATGAGGVVDTLELIEKITGKTATEMEKFGRDLSTKDSVEAIQMVNDALEDAGATTQETRFVTESLASGLGDIIPIWADNGKVIAEYEQILEKAGVIRTRESIEQSAILANQAAATKLQFQGLSNQLVAGTLPALSGLVEYMNSGSESADGLGNKLGFVGVVANSVTSFVIGLSTVFVSFGKVLGGVGALLGSFFRMVSGIVANPFSILDQVRNYMSESGAIGGFIIEDLNKELLRGGAAINSTWNPPKAPNTVKPKVPVIANKGTAGQYDKSAEAAEKAKEAAEKAKEAATKAASKKSSTSSEPRLVGIAGNTGIGTGSHIDIRYANSDPRRHQKPSQDDINRFLVNGKPLGSLTKTSDFNLNRKHPVSGKVQPHYGIDYDTEIGDKITTTSAVKDVKTWYDPNGGGWVTTTTFEDGLAMNILHQDPSVKGKVKSGASSSSSGSKASAKAGDSAQAQAAKKLQDEQDRIREEAARENERRKEAGAKRVFEGLPEYDQIVKEGEAEQKLAMYELADRKADLDKELIRINTDTNNRLTKLYNDTFSEFMTAEDKLIAKRDEDLIDIKSKYAEGDPLRSQAIKATLEAFDKDWEDLKWLAGEEARKRQDLTNQISSSIGTSTNQALLSSIDSQAQLNMSPEEYQAFSRQQGRVADYGNLENDKRNREAEIYETDDKGKLTKDQDQINQLLLEAHEEYLAKKKALDDSYAVKDKTLAEETALAKLTIAQTNMNALGTLSGALFGQQSTAARAVFAMEKGLALQRIFLESKVALSKAWSSAAFPYNLPAVAMAALETGALSSAVQTITPMFSGVAHGGMDYIPSESTFLLDKGERVLSPRQNKDLTDFLSKGGSGTGSGETNISITIDNNGNANMNSDNAAKYSKELSLQVKNLVQASLRQEKRQGGML